MHKISNFNPCWRMSDLCGVLERDWVALNIEKMVGTHLRWFGHVERMYVDYVVRRVDQMKRS